MLSTTKINPRKKNKTEVLLNRRSKRTRYVRKNLSDREIYQLVMHEKNSSSRHVTKMRGGADYAEGGIRCDTGRYAYNTTVAPTRLLYELVNYRLILFQFHSTVLSCCDTPKSSCCDTPNLLVVIRQIFLL